MEKFLERIVGTKKNLFTMEITSLTNSRYYRITSKDGKIHICADSKPNAALGLYRYLKDYLHVNYSWCGNSGPFYKELEGKAFILPTQDLYQEVQQNYISMFNYCTYGYSMVFWSWERWEKELDFLLLNGVNLPLFAVGLEAVWFKTLLKNHFTKEEALAFISSPSHFPWQLMTNIEGIMPIMSEALIQQRLELGQRILNRMLELGMTPVQMGFSGFVPKQVGKRFHTKYPVLQKEDWCGHKGTCELDPLDPLFRKIGLDFLKVQKELFGSYHFYACDPFHESEPPVKRQEYLKSVSLSIQGMLKEFDEEYHWVMQSWSIREGIVTALPKDRLIILDLAGQKQEETSYFWGYDFITGNLHNFGGRINLHGDIKLLAQNQYTQLSSHKNVIGTGLFMEGIDQNPLYYDLAFSMLTSSEKIAVCSWLDDYCIRRYGSNNPVLRKGLGLLAETVYQEGTNGVEKSSIICARPALQVKKSGPNDGFDIPYDSSSLKLALCCYVDAYTPELKDGYYFDIYDMARQVVSNELQEISRAICQSYEEKDFRSFSSLSNLFLERLLLVDKLLLTRREYNLYELLNQAEKYTKDPSVNSRLITAQKALLTTWSDIEVPQIFDYAWREWGGMIGTFYYVRWKLFFAFLQEEFFKEDRYCVQKEEKLEKVHGRESFYANAFYHKLGMFEKSWIKEKYQTVPCVPNQEQTLKIVKEILTT